MLRLALGDVRRDAAEEFYHRDAEALKIDIPDSRRDQGLATWYRTYWKRLPRGQQIDYDIFSDEEVRAVYNRGKTGLRRSMPRWFDTPE